MTLTKVLIVLTCVVGFPVGALAQSPMQSMTAPAGCCAADDGSAAAAAVLLPPMAAISAGGCCQPVATPGSVIDHSAHMPAPAGQPAAPMTKRMGGMMCGDHGAAGSAAKPDGGCCASHMGGAMKDGSVAAPSTAGHGCC